MVTNQPYWRRYHTAETLAQAVRLRESHAVESTGVRLNVDVYEQADPTAPVIIFNHGGGGYSRLFLPLALALHGHGYTVVMPDQRGQGLSDGDLSDFTMGQFVQNILDVTHWARARYAGPLFLAGASLGGALAYKAVAAGAPVAAAICHNLYDFGRARDTLAVSRFAPLAGIPVVAVTFSAITRLAGAILPRLRLPYRLLGRFDKMVDPRATGFYETWKRDPYPIKRISLRYMASTFNTPPAVPLEQNTVPIMVINQTRDEMVSPAATRRNYERLGGLKEYVEIDYGHWAMGGGFEAEWSAIVDQFCQRIL